MMYASLHNHSDYSNLKLPDAINKVEQLIDYGKELGLYAVALTDHDCLTGHVRALNYYNKKYKEDKNYKLILGNEIYITREGLCAETHENGEKFYHCILLAKDAEGHKQLRELSSRAWSRGYVRFIMRTPTYMSDLLEIVKSNPGHLICTTACLGSFTGVQFLQGNYAAIDQYIQGMQDLFGDDFYIELQPSRMNDQIQYNKYLIQNYWDKNKFTIATDSHYLKASERQIHKDFLNSKESKGNREVDEFYASAYMMSAEELESYLTDYISQDKIESMFHNSCEMADKCEMYSLDYPQVVPKIRYEWEKRDEDAYHYVKSLIGNKENLNYYFSSNAVEADKYLSYLISEGYVKYVDQYNEPEKYLNRLEEELSTFKAISENIKQPLSDYFNTMSKIIDIVWSDGDSLVGPGRGSGCGSLINYLLGITQLDPLRQELAMPFWRFLHPSRPELPDIDFDTEALKRTKIFNAVQKYFNSIGGEVINVCTVGTIKTKSAIRTAGKSLGIDDSVINYIVSLIPNERGNDWTLNQCMQGDEDHNKIGQFGVQMVHYPELWATAQRIEGLISNLSVHASGVLILNGKVTDHNSIMKTSRGVIVTAWDLHDSEQLGALKYDFLTVQALDKIRTCMNLLMEDQRMEWQGSLRSTYNKYLLPANLDYHSPDMWKMVAEGKIIELFQFDTTMGSKAARQIKPTSLADMAAGNSVLRLMAEEGDQPLDIFTRNKIKPQLWIDEMNNFGLTEEEQEILQNHIGKVYGVMNSQEDMMLTVMDPKISGFTVKEANKLRKAVAKKKKEMVDECHTLFYEKGRAIGTRDIMLDYVWNVQIARELGYSFSQLHTVAYSTIALQELNLNYYYPKIYWGCACLSVNANAVDENDYEFLMEEEIIDESEDTDEKKTNKVAYDKIAEAIMKFKNYFNIILPDINKSKMGFVPDVERNSIMFGLKGISRIGDDLVSEIINRRPYNSLVDFLQKMNGGEKKLISKDKIINLIKAGCFDEIEQKSREEIMKNFIEGLVERHSTLDLRNFLKLIRYELVPESLNLEKGIYLFTKEARKNKSGDGFYILDEIMVEWYRRWMQQEPVCDNGIYKVSISKWDDIYNKGLDKARKWIKDNKEQLIEVVYEKEYNDEWNKYASGDVMQWELDALNIYYSGHPLTYVTYPFDVTPIYELRENDFEGYWFINGEQIPKMNLKTIVGTVLVKNKKDSIIILSTPDGIIKVKCYKQEFAKYDKVLTDENKNIIQDSFLEKGTHLAITGILRDEMFIPKVYKSKTKASPIQKIELDENGNFNRLVEKQI